MKSVPAEETGVKVKSVFCFAVAPEMRRQGISKLLLERVCLDAARDGFDYIEAYPCKTFANEADDFMGPAELFRQCGFVACGEADNKLIMRKKVKETT